jgi:NHL repeat
VPSTVLNGPNDVAVDGAGNVYVVDNSGFGQVVKLEAG